MANNDYAQPFGKIWYIDDPNSVNINNDMTNSIAQYQDMHIDVSLNAVRRGRSVIETVVVNGIAKDTVGSSDDNVEIGFLGNNQYDKNSPINNNPNIDRFTTNYYEGSVDENTIQYEGFGITKIDIKTDSSFIPVINIEFTDVRGQTFFTQKKSPYKILFDFPPPIFTLRVKGYYGRASEYVLHMVEQTTEFKSDNGNFVINAKFIPLTFAPLTDILFRYVVNAPLIGKEANEIISAKGTQPTSTFDLIEKLKELSDDLRDKIENSDQQKILDKATTNKTQLSAMMTLIEKYNKNYFFNKLGTPKLFVAGLEQLPAPVNSINNTPILEELNSVNEYNKYFTSTGNKPNINQLNNRLYIGYGTNKSQTGFNSMLVNADKIKALEQFGESLVSGMKNANILISNIRGKYSTFLISSSTWKQSNVNEVYAVIDITEFYVKLYWKLIEIGDEIKKYGNSIEDLKNKITIERLGFSPTIKNIFEVIMKDVDIFFNEVRSTSTDAENHHELYKNIILTNGNESYGDNKNKIYAFPLMYELRNCTKVRVSPERVSKTIPTPFPEMELVKKLILSFLKQKNVDYIKNILNQKDEATGINSWIPINPLDSELNPNGDSYSPYGSINLMNSDAITNVLTTLLDRFYVGSQYSYPNKFYEKNSDGTYSYAEYYAKAEATNIALSVITEMGYNNFLTAIDTYLKNINGFYNNKLTLINRYKKIDNNSFMQFGYVGTNTGDVGNGEGAYINKASPNFIGSFFTNVEIGAQIIPENDNNPLRKFIEDTSDSLITKTIRTLKRTSVGSKPDINKEYSNQNILYIYYDDNEYTSPFLAPDYTLGMTKDATNDTYYDKYLSSGNALIPPRGVEYSNSSLNRVWSYILSVKETRDRIKIYLNNPIITTEEKLLMIMSNFGCALSPFNSKYNDLNGTYFNVPAITEIPQFIAIYIGALLKVSTSGSTNMKKILNDNYFFKVVDGTEITWVYGEFIACDSHDFQNYLSQSDKDMFIKTYELFNNLYNDGDALINTVIRLIDSINSQNRSNREAKVYCNELLSGGEYCNEITKILMERKKLVVTSEFTFKREVSSVTAYQPLQLLNNNTNKKEAHDTFFTTLFTELKKMLVAKKEDLIKSDKETNGIIYDGDILNQTYYSLKNINDKWLTSPIKNTSKSNFPYCRNGETLIDLFSFVDRAMNQIGDTIINAESLITNFDDPNISVFSVISELLSINNFEFFPLQNFLTHTKESWDNSFKIDTHGSVSNRTYFVCMYLGGAASQLSGIDDGDYLDDGILEISNVDSNEFICNETSNTDTDTTTPSIEDNVFAFNVMFAQQNQSMFKDIKIQSKDYPETNESIQIMSRLAGDNNDVAPTPKAQNLYNVYEGRAYSATITGLGNMMIQPTQYFQLTNVPLYRGAYMILSVEHNISPNHMTTSFTGTKVGKYPAPRVTQSGTEMSVSNGDFESGEIYTPNGLPNSGVFEENIKIDGILQLNTPLPLNKITRVSSYYGWRPDPIEKKPKFHHGIDLATPTGTVLWADKSGVLYMRIQKNDNGKIIGYGKYVYINHDDNTYSLYGHLSSFGHLISDSGKIRVKAGDVIGYSGNSGKSTGAHLHFEYGNGHYGNHKSTNPTKHLRKALGTLFEKNI